MSCYTEQKLNRQACLDLRDKLLYQPKLGTGDWREKRLEGLGLGVRVNKSKTNTAHNLLCFVLWCVLAFSKLFHWTTYVILCGLKALSVLPSFPLVLPSTLLKWHSVKIKTLSWRNQQEGTSGWSEPRKTHICCTPQQEDIWITHAGHLNADTNTVHRHLSFSPTSRPRSGRT